MKPQPVTARHLHQVGKAVRGRVKARLNIGAPGRRRALIYKLQRLRALGHEVDG